MTENQHMPTYLSAEEHSDSRNRPIKYMVGKLIEHGTTYAIDANGIPCFRFQSDPDRKLHAITNEHGKPTARFRAHVRALYSYLTKQEAHLDDKSLHYITDYCMEEAFKGGREKVNTKAEEQGDYNFEALVVFAQMLQPDEKGEGHKLLGLITSDTKCKPRFEYSKKGQMLSLELRTADLWRVLIQPSIERQVKASKSTLYTAINFFSRRLGELEDRFREVGLEVTVVHRDSGSWTHILRNDANGVADATVLITTDDERITSSSSGIPSGQIASKPGDIDTTDDADASQRYEQEPPAAGKEISNV